MSVIIKNMAMPQSCYFCCLANERFDLCRAVTPHRELEDDCEERIPEWCPLVEVVTCQECKHSIMSTDGYCKYCDLEEDEYGHLEKQYYPADYFCGMGERKSAVRE